MEKFTIIIPSHNRHRYIKRSMEYYKDLNARVIYCDSSDESFLGNLYPNIAYMHLPGIQFAEKVLVCLEKIDNDIVVLCADDDFIIIDSIYKGYSILNESKDYKTVVGKHICFKTKFDGLYYSLYNNPPDDINFAPKENARFFFSNYYQILWGMYYKDNLIRAFKIINDAKFQNDNFIEFVIGSCMCHAGGIKFLKEIWGVRELHFFEHWGSKHKAILNKKIAQKHGDLSKFIILVDAVTEDGYSEMVIDSYIQGNKKNNGILISILKKIIPKFLKVFIKLFIINKYQNTELDLSKSEKNLLKSISNLLVNFS